MQFNPKIENSKLSFENGEVDFIILEAEDKKSSNGNPMTTLKLKVRNGNGEECIIWDNIAWHLNWKIQQLCYAVEMGSEFESGNFPSQKLEHRRGKCYVEWKKGDGAYPPQLRVKYYISQHVEEETSSTKPDFDDEIPF